MFLVNYRRAQSSFGSLTILSLEVVIFISDAMADRGDVIGCMVMFEMAENGEVPILFTLNGKQITQVTISTNFDDKESLLFPFVSMGHKGVTVSAKVSFNL